MRARTSVNLAELYPRSQVPRCFYQTPVSLDRTGDEIHTSDGGRCPSPKGENEETRRGSVAYEGIATSISRLACGPAGARADSAKGGLWAMA